MKEFVLFNNPDHFCVSLSLFRALCTPAWVGRADNPLTCQNQPDPTQSTGLGWFLVIGGLGWVMKKILTAGWVGCKS